MVFRKIWDDLRANGVDRLDIPRSEDDEKLVDRSIRTYAIGALLCELEIFGYDVSEDE